MGDNLDAKKIGLALAIVAVIAYVACAILVAIAPLATVNVFGALFHGIDISKISTTPTLGRTIVGLIEIFILGYILGWLFGVVHNRIK